MGMVWLRLAGSIKLQFSFAKEPYKRDDILQKRSMILSIRLTVATLYLPIYLDTNLQPIADRVARNLEILSKKIAFQYQTYLNSNVIYHYNLVLIVNFMGRSVLR